MKIQIPGKTFLLGEYAVLQGGPAVIACTQPYFVLEISEKMHRSSPFHPDSPAGKFIADRAEIFGALTLTWFSPYPEGGFGASTAEFLSCFQLYHQLTQQIFTQENLYQTYLKYAYNNQGIPPSGADLMAQAQMQEGLVYFQSPSLPLELFSWPFEDMSLLLFKTPHKLPTHEHLQTLKNVPNYSMLSAIASQGYQALRARNKQDLIKAVNDYAITLAELDLTAEATQTLLKQLKKYPACLAAKGCGALGADVIAVLVPSSQKKGFIIDCHMNDTFLLQRSEYEYGVVK